MFDWPISHSSLRYIFAVLQILRQSLSAITAHMQTAVSKKYLRLWKSHRPSKVCNRFLKLTLSSALNGAISLLAKYNMTTSVTSFKHFIIFFRCVSKVYALQPHEIQMCGVVPMGLKQLCCAASQSAERCPTIFAYNFALCGIGRWVLFGTMSSSAQLPTHDPLESSIRKI